MKHLAGFILIAWIAALFTGITGCAGPNYEKGLRYYRPDDAAAAVRELRPLAEQGSAEAQFNFGSLYYQGWGVPQDYKEAVKWFNKAAGQRYVFAQTTLGTIYADGLQGVIDKDLPRALMWFIFAAAQGDMEAMKFRDDLSMKMTPAQITEAQRLAREFKPEDAYTKLLKELTALADKGDAEAQLKVGLMYYNGQGVMQDYAEAMAWFKKSGLQGNQYAQSNVGYMYEKGEGAPQDFVEAVRWYRRAAERGNAQAQYTLGYLYEKGQGTAQDEVQALMWYNIAAAQGDRKAKTSRDRITVWMEPKQIAEAQRLAREFKVVEK